jgi:hypothetical protein
MMSHISTVTVTSGLLYGFVLTGLKLSTFSSPGRKKKKKDYFLQQ